MAGVLLQLVVSGIPMGIIYALIGMSWSLIYYVTGTFHFAHGLIITLAAFVTVLITKVLGLPVIFGFIGGCLIAALLGASIEWGVYRPFRKMGFGQFSIFIVSMGLTILGTNLLQILLGNRPFRILGFTTKSFQLGDVWITNLEILSLVLGVITFVALWAYLSKTTAGKTIRAVAVNQDMSEALGINRDGVFISVLAIGSVIGGLAAILIGINDGVTPFMGTAPLFTAFAVTFLGGIGSLTGAIVGGLLLGVVQSVALLFVPGGYQGVITFVILVLIIIIKPKGLFSKKRT
jgi:branched-subunit amino acid ABC-type transport system permease component